MSDFYEPYAHYARQLKTWFVAYGIGAPVLFASSESISAKVAKHVDCELIVLFFLVGVALQIVGTLFNKYSMWYVYQKDIGNIPEATWRYRISDWYSQNNHTEVLLDIGTVALFALASYKTLKVALGA